MENGKYGFFSKELYAADILDSSMTVYDLITKIASETRLKTHEVNVALTAAVNAIYDFDKAVEASVAE